MPVNSEQEPIAWINVFKPSDKLGYIVPCELTDPDATEFRVAYRGMDYSGMTINFHTEDFSHDNHAARRDTAKYRAENVRSALANAHNAGRSAYAKDLRRFMGVKE